MNVLSFFKRSLAAKLVLAFILTAVPPMLLASYVAATLLSRSVNLSVGRWLHDASEYLFHTIRETEDELTAAHSLLRPRFMKEPVSLTSEELDALAGVDVDWIILSDPSGKVMFANAALQKLEASPLYPGAPFHWGTTKNGGKELAVVVRRDFTTESGEKRILDLASAFDIRISRNDGTEPVELRIFLPDGEGFRQAYASSSSLPYTLPAAAARAFKTGQNEYALLDVDWTDDSPNTYALFTAARDDHGDILAVFAVSATTLYLDDWTPSYPLLFWSFLVCGALLSGCTGYVLARRLTRPIRRLNRGVQSIAAGNFDCQVDVLGNDEVAELSSGFNLMARQLESTRQENLRSARRERSNMLGEIALGFAHEIRNPLLVIKTSAELVHNKLPENGKESRLLGFVIEEVGRIDKLISEFLAFAKPAPLTLGYFRLGELTKEVLELSAAECAARGIACSFTDETDGSGCVLGEKNKIRQVLLNLTINAMEAMPKGGELTLRLSAPEDRRSVVLDIHDTGVGIEEKLLPSIHLPFITTKKNGLGLGLAKAYAIIEEHGGSITCSSAPGQGTLFTIRLHT